MAQTLDERRVALARRMSEVEGISLQEAFRLVPDTEPELDKLVASLNARHGGPGSPGEQKIGQAARRARETGETFGQAARRTR